MEIAALLGVVPHFRADLRDRQGKLRFDIRNSGNGRDGRRISFFVLPYLGYGEILYFGRRGYLLRKVQRIYIKGRSAFRA